MNVYRLVGLGCLLLGLLAVPGWSAEAPVDDGEELPVEAAAITLDGLWIHRRADGTVEYLEIYGGRRFTYRDSRGAAAAGDLEVFQGRLRLAWQGMQRLFEYDLEGDHLTLTRHASDRIAAANHLAHMSPVGDRGVSYQRPSVVGDESLLPLSDAGELAGEWRWERGADRVETLRLGDDGRFDWQGPANLACAGTYALIDGILQMTDGRVTRRFVPRLSLSGGHWSLVLARASDDAPRPLTDLSDVEPRLRSTVRYRRALVVLAAERLSGDYEHRADSGTHRLTFRSDGGFAYLPPTGERVFGRYELSGARLLLFATGGEQPVRQFIVQPWLGGLLLAHTHDDTPDAAGMLGSIVPVHEPFARYRAITEQLWVPRAVGP